MSGMAGPVNRARGKIYVKPSGIFLKNFIIEVYINYLIYILIVIKSNKMSNRLILIDGSAYIFRAYYGLPPMNRPDGTPINAVFGFTIYVG